MEGEGGHTTSLEVPSALRLSGWAISPDCVPQAKHLASQYWGCSHMVAGHQDHSLPYLEQYWINANQFQELFASLMPWACSSHMPVLAPGQNKDLLINFKESVVGMVVSACRAYQGPGPPTPFPKKPSKCQHLRSVPTAANRSSLSPWP
ncbi:hypothetical protein P7K49_003404 [Saguinus oedipus]|uniref:Uncharacterized protein n=1 Tax=Saguinus oedipus TaxID=9490 RepID=A0ABQ9W4G5_SAGOE|nr:hypothetical protein P7K49_003404 [Saguinus oedipus]